MDPSSLETSNGILRLTIDGGWSVTNLIRVLDRLNNSYRFLNTLDFFSRALEAERARNKEAEASQRYNDRDYTIESLLRGRREDRRDGPIHIADVQLQTLVVLAEQYTGQLHLQEAHYSSPGWMEVVASLNPLKLIADFVLEWRQQNVERERAHLDYHAAIIQTRTDAALKIIRLGSSLAAPHYHDQGPWYDWTREVLGQVQSFVDDAGPDVRIKSVVAGRPDELPPPDINA